MKIVLYIICVALLLPLSLLADNPEELLQRAVLAGNVDAIIKLADQALEQDAHYIPAHMAKAVVLYETQRYDESIAAYTKAIDAAPDDAAEAYSGRSMAKRKKGDLQGADEDVERATKLRERGKSLHHRYLTQRLLAKPNDTEALLSQALDKLNDKAYAAAIDDIDVYIESVAPCDNSIVYASKVYAQEMLGDKKGAIATCSDWLAVLPESTKAYQSRARIRRSVGDEQGSALDVLAYQSLVRQAKRHAIEGFTKAIEHDPNFTFAYYERAKLYMELGEYKEAATDLETADRLEPNSKQLKRLQRKLNEEKTRLKESNTN